MTTETAPIRKLYRRCRKGRHGDCPGSFEAHSVCECNCHGEAAAAVEAAQAIVTAPAAPAPTESPITRVRKFAAVRAAAAAAFVPEPDGTYVNHPTRHEADYTLRGVKNLHAYGFFDPCDEHATQELAEIIAFGRSAKPTGSVAERSIQTCLRDCDACRERTREALATFARSQGDVEQAITHKYPKRYRPTRMSRESFIAKYDTGPEGKGGLLLAGSFERGDAVRSSINRCSNRDCRAMHNGMVVLHDTDELCGSCVYAGVKPRKRAK